MAHHHMSYNDRALTFLSDDPICSSQGCKHTQLWGDASENKFPADLYPTFQEEAVVPYNAPAGLDPDIKATIASERLASG